MPLLRKRRIFRASTIAPPRRSRGLPPTLVVGALLVVIAGGAVLVSLPTTPFGRVPASGMLRAAGADVAVIDGATLRLDERVVHLRGVAAPARGQRCQAADGHGFDCGAAAADGLAGLVRDRKVACKLVGREAVGLAQATCAAGGIDLNRAIVADGFARAEGDHPELTEAEATARAARRGLWADAAF